MAHAWGEGAVRGKEMQPCQTPPPSGKVLGADLQTSFHVGVHPQRKDGYSLCLNHGGCCPAV